MTGVVERCARELCIAVGDKQDRWQLYSNATRAVLREAMRGIGDEHLAKLLQAVGDSSDVDDSLDLTMLHTVLSEIMEAIQ